jgi:predicted dehydrogenase
MTMMPRQPVDERPEAADALVSPHLPTGVALVGYGYWGVNLARNLVAADTVRLIGIADGDPGRQEAAKAAFGSLRIWPDLDSVLEDSEVEAVVVATPASTHAAIALRVLESGRHVMVEKPLALNVEDAEAVVEVADRRGRIAMVGHTFLYSPPVRRLRAYIEQGDLGAVQYLYAQRLSLGKVRQDCNALWNFAPHDISIMLHLLGERPVEVSARGFSFITGDLEDVCFASMAFESGIGANLHVSWIDPRKARLLTVVGDRKMAIYNDVSVDQKIQVVDAGIARSSNPNLGEYASMGEFQWRTRQGDIVIPHVSMTEPLLLQMTAFGSACRSGQPPLASARHGAEVVRVLAAIDESARRRGAPVEIAWEPRSALSVAVSR